MTTLGITRERPTHCKHGHEFTPKNTRINRNADGSFRQYVCRTCAREAQRRAVARKRDTGEWEDHLAARRERDRAGRAESAKIRARRERDELAEQNRQDEQEAIMTKARREHTQRYAAHVAAGPFPIVDALVRVPAACRRGHELTARTVHLSTRVVDGETVPGGVECIRCLREDCYRAHYRSSAEVPAEILDEGEFCRQPVQGGHLSRSGHPWATDAGWWTRVEFASGWGFCDPDPTPELRAAREAAQNEADEAERASIAAELDALELRDARLRREQRGREAAASTAAIRAAMTAARGGVAV